MQSIFPMHHLTHQSPLYDQQPSILIVLDVGGILEQPLQLLHVRTHHYVHRSHLATGLPQQQEGGQGVDVELGGEIFGPVGVDPGDRDGELAAEGVEVRRDEPAGGGPAV